MVLSLARLTILLGAGVVGSVMAKEGRLPDFSGIVSSGFKNQYWYRTRLQFEVSVLHSEGCTT
ncbi:hypothetical protein L195_g010877 [Trifolium pratense]|uniref:Uncharacterized protein n=1 Tax=Trifolium pratense TaxID=57577 RepID=A0A2K3PFY9_TRIPR|nr:hypothetical protein L195_g010877 [Trifolium pratense]